MAAPRFALAALVVMLAVITLSEGMRGSGPKKCCSSFSKKWVHKDSVVNYIRTSQRCPKRAVILRTVEEKTLCVNPTAPWVKQLMSYLDAKSARVAETSNL
uniref:Chemokine interleukin-8-like domain-containing protein n=1 Tax=Mola mola TaxID=94237 RepID=A0A3Q3WFI0_MOLML